MSDAPKKDREIWRREPANSYSPSIHVTAEGGIGIDVGGLVIAMDVEDWHNLANAHEQKAVRRQ
jgi:hypothetical protein